MNKAGRTLKPIRIESPVSLGRIRALLQAGYLPILCVSRPVTRQLKLVSGN